MSDEHGCRVCGEHQVEWAHVIGRTHDDRATGLVNPDDIVPLCRDHHRQYDDHCLDLAHFLTEKETTRAIELVGPGLAARRVRSSRTPEPL